MSLKSINRLQKETSGVETRLSIPFNSIRYLQVVKGIYTYFIW